MNNIKEAEKQLIEKRPKAEVIYRYGSGHFKQTGYNDKDKPMLDYLFFVQNLQLWNQENIIKNANDYSLVGRNYVNLTKEKCGGHNKTMFLTNIKEDGYIFKVGITDYNHTLTALTTWNNFYLPARLQKPTQAVITKEEFEEANKFNKEAAMITSILMNDEGTQPIDMLTDLCSLSYIGDTRMAFAENPNKVKNIVSGSLDFFNQTYNYESYKAPHLTLRETAMANIDKLPTNFKKFLVDNIVIFDEPDHFRTLTIKYFHKLNKKESIAQTKTSFLSNGPIKSSVYFIEKVKKKMKR